MSAPHRWSYCEHCMCPMVICGHCGNNTCNGGSGENCPDKCAAAHAFDNDPPEELQRRSEVERSAWRALSDEERQAANDARWARMLP